MEDNETVKAMVPYTQQLNNDLETFYVKLTQFLDPSGLNLIFNVREALLDLYLLYLEVTKRGGYHQVGQENKWCEVVSALKLEGNNPSPTLCAQVEMLYRSLLYEFEKLYFYRSPATQTATGGGTKDYEDYLKAAKISKDYSYLVTDFDIVFMNLKNGLEIWTERSLSNEDVLECVQSRDCDFTQPKFSLKAAHVNSEVLMLQYIGFLLKAGYGYQEPQVFQQAPSNNEEQKKRRGAPRGQSSAYQIFLKKECTRLKADHQEIGGRKQMAIDAWKKMSDLDKKPYVEESKNLKEKNKEAMIIDDNKQKSTQDCKRGKKRPKVCGDHH